MVVGYAHLHKSLMFGCWKDLSWSYTLPILTCSCCMCRFSGNTNFGPPLIFFFSLIKVQIHTLKFYFLFSSDKKTIPRMIWTENFVQSARLKKKATNEIKIFWKHWQKCQNKLPLWMIKQNVWEGLEYVLLKQYDSLCFIYNDKPFFKGLFW